MGLFDCFKKHRYVDMDEVDNEEVLPDKDYEIDNFVVDTFEAVALKCADGDRMEALSTHERTLYVTQTLEQEINNGGFSQYFYNSSGDLANELADAFAAIGAHKTAAICKRALSAFKGAVPTDRTERQTMLERMHCHKLWEKCDDAFYEYEDDLESLNRAYILAHPESFNC